MAGASFTFSTAEDIVEQDAKDAEAEVDGAEGQDEVEGEMLRQRISQSRVQVMLNHQLWLKRAKQS